MHVDRGTLIAVNALAASARRLGIERKTAIAPVPARPTLFGRKGMESVQRDFEIKSIDEEKRTFTGLAAAFSLDQGGDVIMPGAFKRTLADWKRSKKGIIQLIDSHDYGSALSVVGKMIEAKETDEGLEATFEFMKDDATADAVYRRVKGGYVGGLSIGYETVEARTPNDEDRKKGIWRYLKEVKLREVSVVAFPMNRDALIDAGSVKSVLAGLTRESLTETARKELEELQEEIGALLAPVAPKGTSEPAAPPVTELAPDDPKRLQLEEAYRHVLLRSLGQ